ncbi:SDR family NAD(P)-dependent oxidoreductase [Aquihabitans sp. McL0605]|uniref:SDR family NAD(P)-dependent oxidoreductase n=1 Tax=Aquihabitans sp. McL0605 TaxID=3415671 RepID=UPI003CF80427
MKRGPELIDAALEGLIAPSFTRIGFSARQRLFDWRRVDSYDLSGRVIAITGATSGLGRAAAERLAADGATVIVIGRNADKSELVAREIRELTGNPAVSVVVADMGDLDAVRRAADQILRAHDRLDVLIHNAGALSARRAESADGIEMTVASQVVGPFLMTSLLIERLAESGPGRVLTMSSGGMYSAELTVDHLQMNRDAYNGTKQYALAKRAQVTLSELWAQRVAAGSVVFHALHPGWADTPGVESSLPTFHRIVGPLLRDVDAGADTMVWLAADDSDPLASTGGFWLDRRVRSIHRLPNTRRSDTPARRAELWGWVGERAGVTVPVPR